MDRCTLDFACKNFDPSLFKGGEQFLCTKEERDDRWIWTLKLAYQEQSNFTSIGPYKLGINSISDSYGEGKQYLTCFSSDGF